MTRSLYTLLLRLLAPAIWLWMYLRARRGGGDWDILGSARFGRYDERDPKWAETAPVWVHAVSLGETRAAQPLIGALLDRRLPVLLTHTTPTGRAEGQRLFPEALASGQLIQTWLPYDFPGAMRRFFKFFAPRCGILIEREVWPNMIKEARGQGVSVVLVSARFSEASLRKARWARRALQRAYGSLDLVLAQTQADADRLRQVGAFGPHVVGNLKFDVSLSAVQLDAGREWRQAVNRPVIAVASTREGENEAFAKAIAEAMERHGETAPLHMLIPRHPQRFAEAAAALQQHGLSIVRRSADQRPPMLANAVLLGDTLGEMAFYYAAADIAIIGGGFAPLGGQNLIEACAAGTPVIVGPHMRNFAQATHDAVSAGAAIQVSDVNEALRVAHGLIRDASKLEQMHLAALSWTSAHAGATQRMLGFLGPWLGS